MSVNDLLNTISPMVAQAEGAPPGMGMNFIVLILLFAGMWFLIIAPQRKKQKEHDALVKALKSGDSVLTNGGIYGNVINVKSDRLILKIAENTKIELAKNAVATVIRKDDSSSEKASKDK